MRRNLIAFFFFQKRFYITTYIIGCEEGSISCLHFFLIIDNIFFLNKKNACAIMKRCVVSRMCLALAALALIWSGVFAESLESECSEQISLVLPLTTQDAARAMLLFSTLRAFMDPRLVRVLLILVPESDIAAFSWLDGNGAMPFPVNVVPERTLFEKRIFSEGFKPQGYAVQMALKILVGKIVPTPYYLTLDADVMLVRPAAFQDFFNKDGKAMYNPEPRSAHRSWWESSEKLLNLPSPRSEQESDGGFGVTPALLHKHVSSSVIARLKKTHGDSWQKIWLASFGVTQSDGRPMLWSEYTLYWLELLASDRREGGETFRDLYADYSYGDETEGATMKPLCDAHNVWYESEVEAWVFPETPPESCVFVVVQSTSRASPSVLSAKLSASFRFAEAAKTRDENNIDASTFT